MAIRKSAFLMSGDPAASDVRDADWGSSDGWPITNVGFDLGIGGLSSDTPPRPGDIPLNDVEDPPADRMADVVPPEPDPSLDRPSSSVLDPSAGNSDDPHASDNGPPPAALPRPTDFRPVADVPDPPLVDAGNRRISDEGGTPGSTNGPPRDVAPNPVGLSGNTIYFRPDAPPGNSDDSPPSRGADPRVDPDILSDQANADPGPREVWAPLAATSDDPSLQAMLTGAWHL